jgi:hypothetical protein
VVIEFCEGKSPWLFYSCVLGSWRLCCGGASSGAQGRRRKRRGAGGGCCRPGGARVQGLRRGVKAWRMRRTGDGFCFVRFTCSWWRCSAPGFLGARQGGLERRQHEGTQGGWATAAHRGGGAGPFFTRGKGCRHGGRRRLAGNDVEVRAGYMGSRNAMHRVSGRFYMGAGARAQGEGGVQKKQIGTGGSTRGFL